MTLAGQYRLAIHMYRISTGGERRRALAKLRKIATRALRADVRARGRRR